jgi:hypothetical protein
MEIDESCIGLPWCGERFDGFIGRFFSKMQELLQILLCPDIISWKRLKSLLIVE